MRSCPVSFLLEPELFFNRLEAGRFRSYRVRNFLVFVDNHDSFAQPCN